jgi:hypothetical protein
VRNGVDYSFRRKVTKLAWAVFGKVKDVINYAKKPVLAHFCTFLTRKALPWVIDLILADRGSFLDNYLLHLFTESNRFFKQSTMNHNNKIIVANSKINFARVNRTYCVDRLRDASKRRDTKQTTNKIRYFHLTSGKYPGCVHGGLHLTPANYVSEASNRICNVAEQINE